MTVHFAAARNPAASPVARVLTRRPIARVANDNGLLSCGLGRDNGLIQAALRHFAKHGLSAASEAKKSAEAAFFSGDRDGYNWWVGICRTLDKRLAAEIQRKNSIG